MTPPAKVPIVGVMGSGREVAHPALAADLGRALAEAGLWLLTGAGRGVMTAVCRAFFETPGRAGRIIGIVPAADPGPPYAAKAGYPNPWVEIPVLTHLTGKGGPDGPGSRNPINVLTADVVLALAGGAGTRAEVDLALAHGKPVMALLGPYAGDPGVPAGRIGERDAAPLPDGVRRPPEGADPIPAALKFVRENLTA